VENVPRMYKVSTALIHRKSFELYLNFDALAAINKCPLKEQLNAYDILYTIS